MGFFVGHRWKNMISTTSAAAIMWTIDYWSLLKGEHWFAHVVPLRNSFSPNSWGHRRVITHNHEPKSPLPAEIYFDASCFILKIPMNFEFYFIIYWYFFFKFFKWFYLFIGGRDRKRAWVGGRGRERKRLPTEQRAQWRPKT